MFELNKQLVDNAISRRSFIKKMTQAGMSLAGASTLAGSLVVNELLTSKGVVRNYIRFDHMKRIDERRYNCDTSAGVLGWGIGAAVGGNMSNLDRET